MAEKQEKLWKLVNLGEATQLKNDMNRGVASLARSDNTQLRPHLCINGEEGVEVIGKITSAPDRANTEFWVRPNAVISGDDFWLNAKLSVFLDEISFPTNVAELSPQQSGYILRNLPQASRAEVLAKIKRWYLESFLEDVKKGLAVITEQFEKGDPFLESDHNNHIFDIHGGRGTKNIPYTEIEVVGEQLYWSVVEGGTFMECGSDGYERADALIAARRNRQKSAVNEFLGAVRTLDSFSRGR